LLCRSPEPGILDDKLKCIGHTWFLLMGRLLLVNGAWLLVDRALFRKNIIDSVVVLADWKGPRIGQALMIFSQMINTLTGRGYSMSALRAFWLRPGRAAQICVIRG
jgi:hypothetical protein